MLFNPHGQLHDPAVRASLSSNAVLPLSDCHSITTVSAWAMAGLFLLFTASGLVYLRRSSSQAHNDPEEAASWAYSSSASTSMSPAQCLPVPLPAAVSSHSAAPDQETKLENNHGMPHLEFQYTSVDPNSNADAQKVPPKLPAGMSRSDKFERYDGCRRHTIIVR